MQTRGILSGCMSTDEEEIDGKEFDIGRLEELIKILKEKKELHLNFFDDENIDLWIKVN